MRDVLELNDRDTELLLGAGIITKDVEDEEDRNFSIVPGSPKFVKDDKGHWLKTQKGGDFSLLFCPLCRVNYISLYEDGEDKMAAIVLRVRKGCATNIRPVAVANDEKGVVKEDEYRCAYTVSVRWWPTAYVQIVGAVPMPTVRRDRTYEEGEDDRDHIVPCLPPLFGPFPLQCERCPYQLPRMRSALQGGGRPPCRVRMESEGCEPAWR